MRKQSGFTLIELMVVMAIIAILATAGLSAYGGYLKKARDTRRIADLRGIESIIMGSLDKRSGFSPDLTKLKLSILSTNNGILIQDPMVNNGSVCIEELGSPNLYTDCVYSYAPCNDGGYLLRARFESESNIPKYTDDALSANSDLSLNSPNHYDLGSCNGIVGGFDPVEII